MLAQLSFVGPEKPGESARPGPYKSAYTANIPCTGFGAPIRRPRTAEPGGVGFARTGAVSHPPSIGAMPVITNSALYPRDEIG
jgi:hypothetical protein